MRVPLIPFTSIGLFLASAIRVDAADAVDPNARPDTSVGAEAEQLCRDTLREEGGVRIEGVGTTNSKAQADGTVSVWVDFAFELSGSRDVYRCDVRKGVVERHDLADAWTQAVEMPFDPM